MSAGEPRPNSLVRLVLPDVQELLQQAKPEEISGALEPFHSADIADLLEELEEPEAVRLLLNLEPELQVETYEQLEVPDQVRVFGAVGAEGMARIVEGMSADDRADLLNNLPDELGAGLLSGLSAPEAKDAALLATYGEDTAGGIMTSEFVRLSPEMTASEAIARVRAQATSKETIFALYVLDPKDRLVGVCSLARLILAPDEAKVADVMYPHPISMPVDSDQEAVAGGLRHYDFLAMPIVDADGRMVGIVTHDDAFDVVLEEQTEDVQKMAGVEPLEAPYFETALLMLVRKRLIWLTLLLGAGMVAGTLLKGFQATLQKVIALTFFLPLIIAAGGNSGAQSATLVIRGMAVGEMSTQDWPRVARRELVSGLLLGTLLGALGFAMAHLLGQPSVSLTIFLTLIGSVTTGSLLGSLLPMFLARNGIDPAITSSPLVAGLVDIVGIVIYFSIARFVLGI
ncbi:MAG: magnesium transporter [Planctomycetota bacterium]